MSASELETILEEVRNRFLFRYEPERLLLLQYLIAIQDHQYHISKEAIDLLSRRLNLPPAEIDGMVSFYSFLRPEPACPFDILVSDNITDRMQGNDRVLSMLKTQLSNSQARIDTTSCTGMSDQGPAILVNGVAIPAMDSGRTAEVAGLVKTGRPISDWPADLFVVEDNIRRRDLLLDSEPCRGPALQALLRDGADTVLERLDKSGLRGRGGAGFTTATKWRFSRQARASQHFVICNADEGEPGTFKDRVLLNTRFTDVVEGMTICAGIIGANQGFIYLRGEYSYLLPKLEAELEARRNRGLLGSNILGQAGFDFDIDIHLGAGAYICGEESALIESLEGLRGVPRRRPPFPVTQGFIGQPSVVNNVETFLAAAHIACQGDDWFAQRGTTESTGTKLLSVSGDCEYPGVYEYPFGTSLSRVLEDCGAEDVQAVQVAGAAGNLFTPDEFERTIAFEDIATAGSFMMFNNQRNLYDVISNFADFFVHESCGFCTPCRIGTSMQRDLVNKLIDGHATEYDLDELQTIGDLLRNGSHCGLGATAPNAVLDLVNKFPYVIQPKLAHSDYEPAFDLEGALSEARCISGRDDAGAHISSTDTAKPEQL